MGQEISTMIASFEPMRIDQKSMWWEQEGVTEELWWEQGGVSEELWWEQGGEH